MPRKPLHTAILSLRLGPWRHKTYVADSSEDIACTLPAVHVLKDAQGRRWSALDAQRRVVVTAGLY